MDRAVETREAETFKLLVERHPVVLEYGNRHLLAQSKRFPVVGAIVNPREVPTERDVGR